MEMLFSLCVWEGNLFGAAAAPPKSDWVHGTMCPKLWSRLPKEVLEMIVLKMIPDSSKCRFRAVSRQWRQLLSSAEAFQRAAPFSSRLMCNLHWHQEGRLESHMHSCREVELTPAERASLITSCSSLVCKDRVLHLPALPKLWRSVDIVVMHGGLLCIVHGGDVFEPQKADVYVVNPINGTWKLLPKCDGCDIPHVQLRDFRVSVVVCRPPGCGFHVFVIGGEVKVAGYAKHVLRYSSESNNWEAFTGDEVEMERFQHPGPALSSKLLYAIDARTDDRMVYMYHAEEGGRPLAMFKALSFPADAGADEGRILNHLGKTYFVGYQDVPSPVEETFTYAIWELDLVKDTWVLISVAPEYLLVALHRLSPRQIVFSTIQDCTVTDGILAIAVALNVVFGKQEYPNQYVYYDFANKSWYSGSRFFCSKAFKDHVCSGRVHLANNHFSFEPRLDIRLSE